MSKTRDTSFSMTQMVISQYGLEHIEKI